MEESFEIRVKRLFGSKLFETVPENSFPTSSWSVADGEVEKREWNRGGAHPEREDEPTSSTFYDDNGCLAKSGRGRRKKTAEDRKREFEGDLDDDEVEEEEEEKEDDGGLGGDVDEETEIRDSVGLDPTLDNEDEEDEYDRAALCRESAGERLYMGDIKDHGPYLNFHAVVPDFLEEPSDETQYFRKDPRADHFAANVRLKEDKGAAENNCPISPHSKDESSNSLSVKITQDDVTLKPILKRKEVQDDPKPKKRVRFDPGCKDYHDEVTEEPQDFPMVPRSIKANAVSIGQSSLPEVSPGGVPDYVRNPSKYTHYTFDSSDSDDNKSNRQAFEDFLNLVKRVKPDQLQSEIPVELPKSVIFTPRKKSVDVVPMDDSPGNDKGSDQLSGCSMGIAVAVGDPCEDDVCEMDEDDAEAAAVEANMARRGRQYRSKSSPGDSA